MGVHIKRWSLDDWKELLKWAKIGANNAMIGEFTEVEELPPHGDLIDRDALCEHIEDLSDNMWTNNFGVSEQRLFDAPTVIEAEGKT